MAKKTYSSKKLTAYGFVGVFVFGLLAVIVARIIHSLEYPDAYQTTIPSISGTARHGFSLNCLYIVYGCKRALIILRNLCLAFIQCKVASKKRATQLKSSQRFPGALAHWVRSGSYQ